MLAWRTGRKHFHCFKACWDRRHPAKPDVALRIQLYDELILFGANAVEEQPARGEYYGFHRVTWAGGCDE